MLNSVLTVNFWIFGRFLGFLSRVQPLRLVSMTLREACIYCKCYVVEIIWSTLIAARQPAELQ